MGYKLESGWLMGSDGTCRPSRCQLGGFVLCLGGRGEERSSWQRGRLSDREGETLPPRYFSVGLHRCPPTPTGHSHVLWKNAYNRGVRQAVNAPARPTSATRNEPGAIKPVVFNRAEERLTFLNFPARVCSVWLNGSVSEKCLFFVLLQLMTNFPQIIIVLHH